LRVQITSGFPLFSGFSQDCHDQKYSTVMSDSSSSDTEDGEILLKGMKLLAGMGMIGGIQVYYDYVVDQENRKRRRLEQKHHNERNIIVKKY
jgi:hypothetical protein